MAQWGQGTGNARLSYDPSWSIPYHGTLRRDEACFSMSVSTMGNMVIQVPKDICRQSGQHYSLISGRRGTPLMNPVQGCVIGVSLSEPHTSGTVLQDTCVCMYVGLLVAIY